MRSHRTQFRPDSAYRPPHPDGPDAVDGINLWTLTVDDEAGEVYIGRRPGWLHFPSSPPNTPTLRYREDGEDENN